MILQPGLIRVEGLGFRILGLREPGNSVMKDRFIAAGAGRLISGKWQSSWAWLPGQLALIGRLGGFRV